MYMEENILKALNGLREGRYKSIAEAARDNAIPRQTLSDRYNGKRVHGSREDTSKARQLLSDSQETVLMEWAELLDCSANPLDPISLRTLVYQISGKVPGKNWHFQFEACHPPLRKQITNNLDPKRAQNFNKLTIDHFFSLNQTLYEDYPSLPPQHKWNMDEKCVQMGGGQKDYGKAYYTVDTPDEPKREHYRMHSDNLEMITAVECVSAAGESIPTSFILTDGPMPNCVDINGIGSIATSPNGWTDYELTALWFEHVFIPHANEKRVNNCPLVLYLDGQNSHESILMKQIAYENDVIIVGFPSKCTHKLQPLDVGVFGPFQRRWYSHSDRCTIKGKKINRYNIIPEYMHVRQEVVTPALIKSAFQKPGLYPPNPTVFTESDFGPSQSSLVVAHTPKSYPTIPGNPLVDSLLSEIASSGISTINSATSIQNIRDDEPTHPKYDYAPSQSLYAPVPIPIPKTTLPKPILRKRTFSDLEAKILSLRREQDKYEAKISKLNDKLLVSNTHCEIMRQSATATRTELENTKKKTRQSLKFKGQFVTHRKMWEAFEAEKRKNEEKEKEKRETDTRKASEEAARVAQIQHDTVNKEFTTSLSSYNKTDLTSLCGALALEATGTVAEMTTRIKEHLASNPLLVENKRFKGLFGRVEKVTLHS